MDRYLSDPIELPAGERDYARADLIFYAVDHSKQSFQARVFFDNPEADESTPLEAESGYAGAFHVFGHGGCFGEHGHCDVPEGPRDPFDLRSPHQLTPVTKTLIVTDPLRQHAADSVRVTVVPVVRSGGERSRADVLEFDDVRLVTFA
jgi:tyrosinase